MHIKTELAQVGNRLDPHGAISFPIYHSATFRHDGLGESTGFDYSRSGNPTRQALEDAFARLEEGTKGFAFSSGMAAISTILSLFQPGDHLVVSEDLYGGTYRVLSQVFNRFGLKVTYVNTSDLAEIDKSCDEATRAILLETPTNPMLRVSDIRAICQAAKSHNILTIVDNTFMTPFLQRPLKLGADIVVHSATKYLSGHNDVVAGLVVIKDEQLAEKFAFLHNALGAVLGPQDSWLVMRGLKTLGLRLTAQEQNAQALAHWLSSHPLVEQVSYPGLPSHPGHTLQSKQASGFGAMLSFAVKDKSQIPEILKSLKLISYAESLGGVESLITYPATQTHADIPEETRLRLGVHDRLLRLSVGIEDVQDLIDDLRSSIL